MLSTVAPGLFNMGPLLMFLWYASTISAAPASQANSSATILPIPVATPANYVAFGDSFAAGIGAGAELGTFHIDGCHRYDGGYPFLLTEALSGDRMKEENLRACTGAMAHEVEEQASYLDETVDLATISVGGNDVGFGSLINDCIYRFKGYFSNDCETTLNNSRNATQHKLGPAVQSALQAFMDRPHHKKLRIFVTGYARFFNDKTDQCDTVSWNYWQHSPENGTGAKMTKDLRYSLNKLVVDVNSKIEEVARDLNDSRMQFVNYDEKLEKHRFCEERFVEPQRPHEDRPGLFIHQYYTPNGELQDDGEYLNANSSSEAKGLAEGMLQFASAEQNATVAPPFDEQPIDINMFPTRIPSGIMKIFHPTSKGQEEIAEAVWQAYKQEDTPQPSDVEPLAKGFPISDSRHHVSVNFPREFVLEDGKQPVSKILYRMRQEACRGQCEGVNGIPMNLLAYKRLAGGGCEFVTRISQSKELFLFASHAGQNCWDATERMIEGRMTDNGEPIFTESWVNGGKTELYHMGIRDFNTTSIDSKASHHLGHFHVACRRFDQGSSYRYEVYTNNWNDGNWGQSILNAINGCRLLPSKWMYEVAPSDEFPQRAGIVNPHRFKDGTSADRWARWTASISNDSYAKRRVEEAMGLRAGGLDCPVYGDWFELNLFS